MLVTLFSSLGTPMLLAGDEFGRTQGGNNNAYCQDNEINWMDWSQAKSEHGQALTNFVSKLIALRKRHSMLRSRHFLYGQEEPAKDLLDIDWFDERGERLSPEDWGNPEGRALVMQRACKTEGGDIQVVSLALNASPSNLTFKLPASGGAKMRLLIDSGEPDAPERDLEGEFELRDHAAAILIGTIRAEPS